ncbi:MAG: outer membrane beta-barrel protein [Bacteroidales bacterium]|nr:outer membrane beta-barrel protein [Bacteroidales bacterium]
MRRILLVLVSLFAAVAMSAQNVNVTVKLEDASNGEPVGFATVSLTPEKGSAKYALTDHDGKGTIEKVKAGKYTFKAEIMGYKPYEKAVEVGREATDLGVVKMELDQEVLDAASVSATGNPIIIKKDTVEYNASSFKTTDTDMLINLLKKLPGIEVDDNGSITANGETITKITIDGKTFFLDDPQIASQNLPAKMIEKVKVVKKKSEQAEFTGIDDGNDETIIDLSVQKSMMNGIFGNVTGGVGHDIPSKENDMNDWRYTGNGMVGRFTDDSQLSVIANGNNGAGGMGFTNMGGNMMGQMMGGGRGMGGGMMGGMGGFGGFGGGITTSWMGGVNAAADLLDDKMQLSGNYMLSGSNTESLNESYQENYYDGWTQIQETTNTSNQRNNSHMVGVRLDHKFSDNTSILFQPQFNYSRGAYNQTQVFDTWKDLKNDANKASDGFSTNYGLNSNWSANGFLLFRQRLGMPGRTLSLNLNWTLSNNHSDGYNQSLTNTINGMNPGAAVVNQRVDQASRTQNAGARLVYTEPLGGGFYVEGSYQYNFSQSNSNKDVYNSKEGDFEIDSDLHTMKYLGDGMYDAAYSNKILNRNINQSAGLAFMYQEGDVRAQLGITANPQHQHNETTGHKPTDIKVLNWAPRAMLFYDFNDNANIRINYNGRSGQPSTSQLMPVLDNSNPLSMTLGNPYLTPYFNHNGRIELEYSNRQTFFTARLNLQGGMNQNPIVNASWNENGRQYSFPVNGKNTYNGSARVMVNAPIAKSNFSISNNSNINYSSSTSYVGKSGEDGLNTKEFWNDEMTSFDYVKFHEKHPDPNNDPSFIVNSTRTLSVMERLNLNYRSDYLEVRLNGGTRFNKPWYSVKNSGNTENVTWNNSVGGSINWTIGYTGLTFTTDANYNWYNGYKTEQPSRLIWNAGLQMPIIYNQATIALNAYDILGQRKNLSTTQNENLYSESRSLSIGRYIIVSFTWRFGTFGGRNGRMGGFGGFGGGRGGRGGRGGMGGGRGMGGGMMGGGMMGGGMMF